jgi:acetyltransferase-like isoleucine patch superfamily enzyme
MSKKVLVVLACCGAFLAMGSQGAAAGSDGTTVCDQNTQAFSGTTTNLIVPIGGYCAIDHATITQNLVVQNSAGTDVTNSSIGYDMTLGNDSGATLGNSSVGDDVKVGFNGFFGSGLATVGHDLIATHAGSIQIGSTGPPPDGFSGRTTVGHDVVVNGSPGPPDPGAFVFDSLCDLGVGNDLVMKNRWVTLGFTIGDETAPFSACIGTQPDSVGHDVVVTNNKALSGFFGPTSLEVGDIQVGNDATFSGNSAVPGGFLEFNDNTIAHDATCSRNTPSITGGLPDDGPNQVGGTNNGCP